MRIGYARVSTPDQHLELQIESLKKAGCEHIFTDVATGANTNRAGLKEAIQYLRHGDALMVCHLDRLGRNQLELARLLAEFEEKGVYLFSLSENIDTNTPFGKMFFQFLGIISEMERNLILERTKAGRENAKAKGKHLGRPATITDDQIKQAIDLNNKGMSHSDIAALYSIKISTYYKALKRYKDKQQ